MTIAGIPGVAWVAIIPGLLAFALGVATFRRQSSADRTAREERERAEKAAAEAKTKADQIAESQAELAKAERLVDQYQQMAEASDRRTRHVEEQLDNQVKRNREMWAEWDTARASDLAMHRAELHKVTDALDRSDKGHAECMRENAHLRGRIEELEVRVDSLKTALDEARRGHLDQRRHDEPFDGPERRSQPPSE